MLSPANNLMVKQLISDKYEKLLPSFQLVCLEADQLIFRPYETIQYVFFPVSAIIAMQIDISDGSSVDIVLIGKEGMVGSGVMGGNQNFSRAKVKFSGFAYKLPLSVFLSELAQDSAFLKIDHDARIRARLAHTPAQAQTIFTRQIQVDQVKVESNAGAQIVQARRAIGGVYIKTMRSKMHLDFFTQQTVVLHQGQNQGPRCVSGVSVQWAQRGNLTSKTTSWSIFWYFTCAPIF